MSDSLSIALAHRAAHASKIEATMPGPSTPAYIRARRRWAEACADYAAEGRTEALAARVRAARVALEHARVNAAREVA